MRRISIVCLLLIALMPATHGLLGCSTAMDSQGRWGGGGGGLAESGGITPVTAYEEERKGLDVPYVPTPEYVVDAMLDVARVGSDDVLYDLGCGDGRIVITAAKRMGTKGVGIDLDPERIRESNMNAAQEEVTDRVTFMNQDLFTTDISEATVLTLYLLPSVNVRVRPKIFNELKPGTRVVSHEFDMDDWEPDRKIDLGAHTVFFWVVPANVSGTWEWSMPSAGGTTRQYVLQMNQKYQKVDGTVTSGVSPMPLEGVKLVGDRLRFTIEDSIDGKPSPVRFEGRVSGDTIEGTLERTVDGGQQGATVWRAYRNPGTSVPIDAGKELSI